MLGAGASSSFVNTSVSVNEKERKLTPGRAVAVADCAAVSAAPFRKGDSGTVTRSWVVRYARRAPYAVVLREQERLLEGKLAGDPCNYLLLVEHEPVYTIGRGGSEADLCGAPERLAVPVFRVGRGGGVTFHGPGQLVAYPVCALVRRDVRRYVDQLQAVLVRVCERFGLPARGGTESERIGVWIEDRKVASIGIGIRRWIAYHGVALNIDVELEYFRAVVPCRMPGLPVTSLARELGYRPTWEQVAHMFLEEFLAAVVAEKGEAC